MIHKRTICFLSSNNPLLTKIAENKISVLNDQYTLISKKEKSNYVEKINKLVDWNKKLQEENLKLKTKVKNNDKENIFEEQNLNSKINNFT